MPGRQLISLVDSVAISVAVSAPLALAGLGFLRGGQVIPQLTRDMAAVAGVHPLTSVVSSLGCFIWFGAGVVPLFCWQFTRTRISAGDAQLLLTGAFISLFYAFDDFFMFHESLATAYFGLSEIAVLAVLGMVTVAYAVASLWVRPWRKQLWLVMALAFLGASVVIDAFTQLASVSADWAYLAEDGAKWVGIVLWGRHHHLLALWLGRTAVERVAGIEPA